MAVDWMLNEWKLVEEGGKSLKGACEQLLEERVWMSIYYSVHYADHLYPRNTYSASQTLSTRGLGTSKSSSTLLVCSTTQATPWFSRRSSSTWLNESMCA